MTAIEDYYVWGHQNDRLESQRLTHQHFLIKDLCGGLLQPTVAIDLATRNLDIEPLRIADIACGNGIWAHEVATSDLAAQKQIQVTGLDLTDELCPPENERPDNVHFGKWDMYTAPPAHFHGIFDVVNIRLVFGAVKNNDPEPILQDLLQLLRPGGWLQWCEFDFDNPIAPADSAYLHAAEMFKVARQGHSNSWIPKLGDIFTQCGVEDVGFDSKIPRREMMRFWKDNWYIGVANLIRVVKNEKVSEIWAACEKERVEKGMDVVWPTVVVVGRKS